MRAIDKQEKAAPRIGIVWFVVHGRFFFIVSRDVQVCFWLAPGAGASCMARRVFFSVCTKSRPNALWAEGPTLLKSRCRTQRSVGDAYDVHGSHGTHLQLGAGSLRAKTCGGTPAQRLSTPPMSSKLPWRHSPASCRPPSSAMLLPRDHCQLSRRFCSGLPSRARSAALARFARLARWQRESLEQLAASGGHPTPDKVHRITNNGARHNNSRAPIFRTDTSTEHLGHNKKTATSNRRLSMRLSQ